MVELKQIRVCGNCSHSILCPTSHWTNICPICGHPLIGSEDQDGDQAGEAIKSILEKIRGGGEDSV